MATFALSMWISNTACAMLMLPIGLAMLKILDDGSRDSGPRSSGLATPLLMMIAWAATLGGMATPVGSPTNAQALALYETWRLTHPDAPPVYFSEWLLSCAPIALVYLAVTWWILTRQLPQSSAADAQLQDGLRSQLRALGAMSRAEFRMAATFLLTAVLWVTRLPLQISGVTILPGWLEPFGQLADWIAPLNPGGPPFPARGLVSDATVGVLLAILLFVIPSGARSPDGRSVPLMDWPTAKRLPWDMILLFGGGFALASGFEATGLDKWLGMALQPYLAGQPAWIVVAVVSLLLIMLTELTSNVATVSAFVPPLLVVAEQLQMDPRMMLIPATLAASAGFMLPVGTPPNAIVFSSGRIPAATMARRGLILNLLGVPLLTLGTWLLLRPVLGIR
jgi:sodium-dependent dicarboxylate transporter 2/3/5